MKKITALNCTHANVAALESKSKDKISTRGMGRKSELKIPSTSHSQRSSRDSGKKKKAGIKKSRKNNVESSALTSHKKHNRNLNACFAIVCMSYFNDINYLSGIFIVIQNWVLSNFDVLIFCAHNHPWSSLCHVICSCFDFSRALV